MNRQWGAATLEEFLARLEAGLVGGPETDDPKWRALAKALLAASRHD